MNPRYNFISKLNPIEEKFLYMQNYITVCLNTQNSNTISYFHKFYRYFLTVNYRIK